MHRRPALRRAAGALVTALASLSPSVSPVRPDEGPRPSPADRRGGAGLAGIGDPYFPLDGNGGMDVLHYSVHDRYSFARGRLTGWTRLQVRATQNLSSFHLDLLLAPRR